MPTGRFLIRSLKVKYDKKKTLSERFSDTITLFFGSMPFLLFNVIIFAVWISLNINLIPKSKPFDPFPFGFLTMIVSLEAIILSIFVLISQNRAAKVDDLRDEVDLEVDLITEKELTKLMKLILLLLKKSGYNFSKDQELKEMLKPINESRIEKTLEKQI